MKKPWLLSRRITLAFGLTTLLLSLTLALIFGWAVWFTTQEEINSLVGEELEEGGAFLAGDAVTPESFAHQAKELCALHAGNRIAWRVWDERGERWGDFGASELSALLPDGKPRDGEFVRVDAARRVAASILPGKGWTLAVAVDGSHQLGYFLSFLGAAAASVLLATTAATLAGRVLARRLARLLGKVAESARTENTAETWVSPNEAPEEIQAVVRALQDTLRRIRDETENVRMLTSGMAHELRSPLQNLMGETQVTLLREREPEEYRRVLESQIEELGEFSRVVDNMVTLASVEEARRRRSQEFFDLAKEARLRLAREFKLARRRGVTLELLADEHLEVEGDRESLLLALRNLVTNAIEWSPAGKLVQVALRRCGEELELLVDDSGPGIPPAERERIFRPFHQGQPAVGRRVGFGLGLALTQSAVSAHGGRIEVGDSPLGGARMRVVLPARWRDVELESGRVENVSSEASPRVSDNCASGPTPNRNAG